MKGVITFETDQGEGNHWVFTPLAATTGEYWDRTQQIDLKNGDIIEFGPPVTKFIQILAWDVDNDPHSFPAAVYRAGVPVNFRRWEQETLF